jgi:hypothetical protein
MSRVDDYVQKQIRMSFASFVGVVRPLWDNDPNVGRCMAFRLEAEHVRTLVRECRIVNLSLWQCSAL